MNMEQKGYGFAFLAGVAFGTNGIISFFLRKTGVGPYEQTFLRLFFAFFITFVFYMISDRKLLKIEKKEINHILLIGIISQGLMGVTLYKSMAMTSITVGVILSGTGPLFTAILSKLFFNEKINLFKWLALALGFYGAFLIVAGGDLSILNTNKIGILIGIISGISYGLFPILKNDIPKDYNPQGILMYSFLVGSICVIPLLDMDVLVEALSLKMIGLSVIVGLVPTIMAYFFYSKALKFTTPTKASIMSLTEIPTTAIIGHFFLTDYLYFINILGIVVLLTGISVSKIELPSIKKIQIKNLIVYLSIF
jgi:drug/metabolite transporter (DMT)-like permease